MTTLIKGRRYIGTVTGVFDERRIDTDVQFTAAINQDPEPAVRHAPKGAPDQDSVLVVSHPLHPDKTSRRLYVAGSIREA